MQLIAAAFGLMRALSFVPPRLVRDCTNAQKAMPQQLQGGLYPVIFSLAIRCRLARLSLTATPPGIMTAIAMTHNLLRRHPGCIVLVHREGGPRAAGALFSGPDADGGSEPSASGAGQHASGDDLEDNWSGPAAGRDGAGASGADAGAAPATAGGMRGDPYLWDEPDPAKSLAIHSSLWEFDAMRSHYCPEVRRSRVSPLATSKRDITACDAASSPRPLKTKRLCSSPLPQVARFVSVLEKDMGNKRKGIELDLQAMLEGSYETLFSSEVRCSPGLPTRRLRYARRRATR